MSETSLAIRPAEAVPAAARRAIPWIRIASDAPYFETDTGESWTPVGQNDSVSWIDLQGLFRRRDLAGAEAYLRDIAASGVTCLRLMLECAHHRHRYFEKPAGRAVPAMVQVWDDLFALCERHGLRVLLTPVDTFWTWNRWRHHPYNKANGGPLAHPSRWLLDPAARDAIKRRFDMVIERWGGSGVLFAWDLWNEIHPAQAANSTEPFHAFIADLSRHVRAREQALYGRSRPQTVSLFGPELVWRPDLDLVGPVLQHRDLDFATVHVYEENTIDLPRDTVAPAVAMGAIVARTIAALADERPFFDSEHGPIHGFKDRKKTLPDAFDDEYFRHMQWAHLASGGAGGGLRWPYRSPHRLTSGMRDAQRALADFLPLVDWSRFRRRALVPTLQGCDPATVATFACGDRHQAIVYLLRRDITGADGRLDRQAAPLTIRVALDGFEPGEADVFIWGTEAGVLLRSDRVPIDGEGRLRTPTLALAGDLGIAVRRRSRATNLDPLSKCDCEPS